MPNWCYNSLTVSHEDPAMVERFIKSGENQTLFADLVPLNEQGEWDYSVALEKWGTKWDVNGFECMGDEGNLVDCSFDTAWGPPIAFFEALEEMGFTVRATYFEEGMCFAGIYEDGSDDCYDYDFSDPDWAENMPEEVVDMLEGAFESWREWQDEEDEEE